MTAAISFDSVSEESARSAGLRYVHDDRPGIARRHAGAHFRYLEPNGRGVRDEATLRRVRSLAIPPAWEKVWIYTLANGHLQATGRDAKGRKQYRYHPRWREVRDETKYHRMIAFDRAAPRARTRRRGSRARRVAEGEGAGHGRAPALPGHELFQYVDHEGGRTPSNRAT
jgi:DNA topoisomerase-1